MSTQTPEDPAGGRRLELGPKRAQRAEARAARTAAILAIYEAAPAHKRKEMLDWVAWRVLVTRGPAVLAQVLTGAEAGQHDRTCNPGFGAYASGPAGGPALALAEVVQHGR